MKEEIEVKLPISDPDRLRARLREIGAVCEGASGEENIVFDRNGELAARGEVLRLRQDRRAWLTWKGPATSANGLKSRAEAQTVVEDFAACRMVLEQIGFRPAVSYAKQREVWLCDGVEVSLDQLDFGDFVEIEGAADRIALVAQKLALDLGAALESNYVELQAAYRAGELTLERFADA